MGAADAGKQVLNPDRKFVRQSRREPHASQQATLPYCGHNRQSSQRGEGRANGSQQREPRAHRAQCEIPAGASGGVTRPEDGRGAVGRTAKVDKPQRAVLCQYDEVEIAAVRLIPSQSAAQGSLTGGVTDHVGCSGEKRTQSPSSCDGKQPG